MNYKGWTITAYQANVGYLATLVDPHGKKLDGPPICLPSSDAAERYVQKFIDRYIKLEERREIIELPRMLLTNWVANHQSFALANWPESSDCTISTLLTNLGIKNELKYQQHNKYPGWRLVVGSDH